MPLLAVPAHTTWWMTFAILAWTGYGGGVVPLTPTTAGAAGFLVRALLRRARRKRFSASVMAQIQAALQGAVRLGQAVQRTRDVQRNVSHLPRLTLGLRRVAVFQCELKIRRQLL